MTTLTDEQANAILETKKFPRITQEFLDSRIVKEHYVTHDQLTICVLTLDNGYLVIDKAAPADPRNFDPELGKKFARGRAVQQLWGLYGFRLCDHIEDEKRSHAGEEPLPAYTGEWTS